MTTAHQTNRIACVYATEFLLQIALRDLPNDCQRPVVLVDRNNRQALVIAVDSRAAKHGIYPGLPYVNAVSMCPELHATYPHLQSINRLHERLIKLFQLFSPTVEPVSEMPGGYYIGLKGMDLLEPDLNAWAERLQKTLLKKENLQTAIVIGFTRFGVSTVASCTTENIVLFQSVANERKAAFGVPLKKLALPAKPVSDLEKLGICTVGKLQELPEWEVRARFAEPLFDLVQRAKALDSQVYGVRASASYTTQMEFDDVQSDVERIVAVIEQLCAPLLKKMEMRMQGVTAIHLRLKKDFGDTCEQKIKTAEPTLAMPTLTEILRLRLRTLELNEGIVALFVRLHPGTLPDLQPTLHPTLAHTERNLYQANQAIVRISAEFGAQRILKARCQDSHLPEETFKWECFNRLQQISSKQLTSMSVMRRFLHQPCPALAPQHTSPKRIFGPYSTSGFWWRNKSIQRRSYFVETSDSDTQWIFYDPHRRRWFTQGFVQ